MLPPQQFTGHGPSSPGTPGVPPVQPSIHLVFWPTSSTSTAQGQLPSTPGIPPISLSTKRFEPAAGPGRTDFAGIADMPLFPERSYNRYDAHCESED
jgi:hypothetical protein